MSLLKVPLDKMGHLAYMSSSSNVTSKGTKMTAQHVSSHTEFTVSQRD